MTTTTMMKARGMDWHTQEWTRGVGRRAALMKFNGATDEQVRDRVERDYPGSVDHAAYLGLARSAYRALWAKLAPHAGKGFLARLTWDDELVFVREDRLAEVPDAGWNWVKELRGVA